MITKHNFLTTVLLGLVTGGIYTFYVYYKITTDINTMNNKTEPFEINENPTMVIILSILTCGIFAIFWMYKTGDKIHAMGAERGIEIKETGTSYLLFYILGSFLCVIATYYGLYLFLNNYSKVVDDYNEKNGFVAAQ